MDELVRLMAILMLASIALAAWILVYAQRPQHLRNFLRGTEVTLSLAIALGSTFRLIQTLFPSTSPGMVLLGLMVSSVVWLLLWCRIIRVRRHGVANKEQLEMGKRFGIDTDALVQQERAERKS